MLKRIVRSLLRIKASVYGLNKNFEEKENESPLNVYAESKLLFDRYIMNQEYPAVGLRYFNVYEEAKKIKENGIHGL